MARFMGTETEYGIATPSRPELSPIVTSTHVVVAYAARRTYARTHWDFQEEYPLRDSRGFDLRRYHTVPVIAPDALGVANVVLRNGARFYVDHAHPEYSSPEVNCPRQAALYDAAGDIILNRAVADVAFYTSQGVSVLEAHDPCPETKIYKNNVDGKGAAYGFHENYQYSRDIDFDILAQALIPYFVCRQVVVGAGRVGIGEMGEKNGFQISQRADYFQQEISLETTLNRGIINTRDEPHADPNLYGRLHVINGDATMSHTSTFLKLGMTAQVIDAIEAGVDFSDLALADPVAEFQRISHDPTCTYQAELKDGRKLSALDILGFYRERVRAFTEGEKEVLQRWDEVVALLREQPLLTAGILDWTAKYALVSSYVERGVPWDSAKLKLIDLQYSDIDPSRSLYHALVKKGRMRTLFSSAEIEAAACTAPKNSRAYFRGRVLEKFGDHVRAASWQNISLALGDQIIRIPIVDVAGWTEEHSAELIDSASSVEEFIHNLRRAELID